MKESTFSITKITMMLLVAMFVSYSAQADDSTFSLTAEETANKKVQNTPKKAEKNDQKSLQEYMQSETSESESSAEDKESKGEENKTWITDLVGKVAEKGAKVISADDDIEVNAHRSNASVFDISGIMLRMNSAQVNSVMQKRSYQKTSEKREIPNFIRWRYEDECRNQGVVGYERIGNCVVRMAEKNNYQYVQQMIFNNFRTKESLEVFFTSNFTGNKVYRIIYHTDAANITGSGAKANYLRNIKIYDFWKKINQKYGVPDNKERVTWGLGVNQPFLQAATGRLLLFDPMLLELDYTRMSREDQKFLNTAVYTF